MPDIKYNDTIEKIEILEMLHKLPSHFYHMKVKDFYNSGIALYTKRGKSLIVYDKGIETFSKKSHFNGFSWYNNILRVEYRYTKNNIRTIAKSNNIKPTLIEFVTEEMYFKYFIEEVARYFFKSDFRDLKTTKKIIRDNSNYSPSLKKKLLDYVNTISKSNFDNVAKKLSYNTIKQYNKSLVALNLNPLTTLSSNYLDGIYKKIVEKSKDYFGEENKNVK